MRQSLDQSSNCIFCTEMYSLVSLQTQETCLEMRTQIPPQQLYHKHPIQVSNSTPSFFSSLSLSHDRRNIPKYTPNSPTSSSHQSPWLQNRPQLATNPRILIPNPRKRKSSPTASSNAFCCARNIACYLSSIEFFLLRSGGGGVGGGK